MNREAGQFQSRLHFADVFVWNIETGVDIEIVHSFAALIKRNDPTGRIVVVNLPLQGCGMIEMVIIGHRRAAPSKLLFSRFLR